ncbi:hypothetical protein EB093_09745 [bacterium]|nr:hypothetical protein [bacterium]
MEIRWNFDGGGCHTEFDKYICVEYFGLCCSGAKIYNLAWNDRDWPTSGDERNGCVEELVGSAAPIKIEASQPI